MAYGYGFIDQDLFHQQADDFLALVHFERCRGFAQPLKMPATLCGSRPGFAPPGREFSRFPFLSVDGGFDDVHVFLSGR
jgi:hypothetical protein